MLMWLAMVAPVQAVTLKQRNLEKEAAFGAGRAINAALLSFSSYIGPIVNLSYDDPSLLRVSKILGVGSLRYPGGTPANNWNITSGRWIQYGGNLAARVLARPEGTFTPVAYMKGIGSTLRKPPIWNLNLATLPEQEMLAQVDSLKANGIPVERIELGNEKINEDCEGYFKNVSVMVPHIRKVFPKAEIGIVGGWAAPWSGLPKWNECEQSLKDRRGLYDAVTVHMYAPGNKTLMDYNEADRRTVTLMSPQALLEYQVKQSALYAGGVPIWLDELNLGGPWQGGTCWPDEVHGSIRGLHYLANFMGVVNMPEGAVNSLNWYALFHQFDVKWSYWASCVHVPGEANRPDLVEVDGTAQVFAHLSSVALSSGHTQMHAVTGTSPETLPASLKIFGRKNLPCIVGVSFTGNATKTDIILLNRCSKQVKASVPNLYSGKSARAVAHVYDGGPGNEGGWVLLDKITSLDRPPWIGGPLKVGKQNVAVDGQESAFPVELAPVSAYFFELEA